MGLWRRLFEGRAVKDGVAGEALILACMLPYRDARHNQITARLRVSVPGREPYVVEKTLLAARLKSPVPGWTFPVLVDRHDPEHVQVVWEDVPDRSLDEIRRAVDEALDAGRLRFETTYGDLEKDARNLFDHSSDSTAKAIVELTDPGAETTERTT